MLDYNHLIQNPQVDIKSYFGNSVAAGVTWATWQKPRGKTMAYILAVGQGGSGGTGVIGANSTAGGGAGGGCAAASRLLIPLMLLPDTLYISAGNGPAGVGVMTYVSIRPNTTTNHLVLNATGGNVGGNASAGTGGTVGTAATAASLSTCPLAGAGVSLFLAGLTGIAGGAAVAGAALTLPTTGQFLTGGTGGGGLPAAAATGTNGGSFTVPAAPSPFPAQAGGVGSATATVPAANGAAGFKVGIGNTLYFYGGTGAASTHGTATGAGLAQGSGGHGGPGCGGGGMGGALTGSSAGVQSLGGPGFVYIICW